jgi:DNA-binding CsgD family transcriptional regulator
MLKQVLSLAEPALAAKTGAEASKAFFDAVAPRGASYLQTRAYRRPAGPLTSATHWRAGGFVARFARPGWVDSAAFNYVCFECNPLLGAIRETRTRYRFSDFAPHGDKRYAAYWEAMGEAGMQDALCATSYGARRSVASLHLGFPERTLGPDDAAMFQLAGLMLTERIMDLAEPAQDDGMVLTGRERDCMAFVAEGKSDWEISVILGISQATAKFHVDNARRKLGATNRAHAVARFVASGLLDSSTALN